MTYSYIIPDWEKQRKHCVTTNTHLPRPTLITLPKPKLFKHTLASAVKLINLETGTPCLRRPSGLFHPVSIRLLRSISFSNFLFFFPYQPHIGIVLTFVRVYINSQIYALQAEALLKLHRHQEAYASFRKRPNLDINPCIEFFGPDYCAYLLIIQAQLYMTMGRFIKIF